MFPLLSKVLVKHKFLTIEVATYDKFEVLKENNTSTPETYQNMLDDQEGVSLLWLGCFLAKYNCRMNLKLQMTI